MLDTIYNLIFRKKVTFEVKRADLEMAVFILNSHNHGRVDIHGNPSAWLNGKYRISYWATEAEEEVIFKDLYDTLGYSILVYGH